MALPQDNQSLLRDVGKAVAKEVGIGRDRVVQQRVTGQTLELMQRITSLQTILSKLDTIKGVNAESCASTLQWLSTKLQLRLRVGSSKLKPLPWEYFSKHE